MQGDEMLYVIIVIQTIREKIFCENILQGQGGALPRPPNVNSIPLRFDAKLKYEFFLPIWKRYLTVQNLYIFIKILITCKNMQKSIDF